MPKHNFKRSTWIVASSLKYKISGNASFIIIKSSVFIRKTKKLGSLAYGLCIFNTHIIKFLMQLSFKEYSFPI
jgi:hypothetical protein